MQPLPIEASDLMLATLHKRAFSDPQWAFEFQYDGFRCLARKTGETVELISRNGEFVQRLVPGHHRGGCGCPRRLCMGCGADRRRRKRALIVRAITAPRCRPNSE